MALGDSGLERLRGQGIVGLLECLGNILDVHSVPPFLDTLCLQQLTRISLYTTMAALVGWQSSIDRLPY